jgi:hypothetical protein
MEPIVYGITKKYLGCMKVERVNYHARSEWHELLSPIGSPEFALLNGSREILHRWFGVVDAEEFAAVIDPLCG